MSDDTLNFKTNMSSKDSQLVSLNMLQQSKESDDFIANKDN